MYFPTSYIEVKKARLLGSNIPLGSFEVSMQLYFTYGYIKPASHLLQDPRLHPAESSLASFIQPRHVPCSTVSALHLHLRLIKSLLYKCLHCGGGGGGQRFLVKVQIVNILGFISQEAKLKVYSRYFCNTLYILFYFY